jgi:hypothetical protein
MKGKAFAAAAVLAAALTIVGAASASRASATYCVGGVTVGPTDSYILAFEAGRYGSGMVSTDEDSGGYWFADEDSDDVTTTLGPCVTAPEISNNAWVASGTTPFGETQARTTVDAQALLDGTYVGIDGVYRTPIATQNPDGSWSLHAGVSAGYKLNGMAVGGDFTDPHAITFPVTSGVLDSKSVLPGQLTAGVYFVAVKAAG